MTRACTCTARFYGFFAFCWLLDLLLECLDADDISAGLIKYTIADDTTTDDVVGASAVKPPPVFRRVIFDSDEDNEPVGRVANKSKAPGTQRSSDSGQWGTAGKKGPPQRGMGKDASSVVPACGVRRAIISSDEEEEPHKEPVAVRPSNEPVVVRPSNVVKPSNEPVVFKPSNEPVVVKPSNEPVIVRPSKEPVVVKEPQKEKAVEISSDSEDEPHAAERSKCLQEGSNSTHVDDAEDEDICSSDGPGGGNEPGGLIAAVPSVGVALGASDPPPVPQKLPVFPSHDPSSVLQKVADHPQGVNLPPQASPAFTKYRVPPSQGRASPPSVAAKKYQFHHIHSTQKARSPQEGPSKAGVVGAEGGIKKTSPVLFQPDNQVALKHKSPQEDPVKAGVVGAEGGVKKTSPVLFQPDNQVAPKHKSPQEGPVKAGVVGAEGGVKKTSPVLFQPDNQVFPTLHKVTPPQSSKVAVKPPVPESGGVGANKQSQPVGLPAAKQQGPGTARPKAEAGGPGAEAEDTDGVEPEFKVAHQYRTLLQQFQQLEVHVCTCICIPAVHDCDSTPRHACMQLVATRVWMLCYAHVQSVMIHTCMCSISGDTYTHVHVQSVMIHTCTCLISDDTHMYVFNQ